ncbi:hypothetical protein [Stutzerimonas stutzeri]|uniref:hypothetical protein n=1 Tax=Stutzerimonas stutzeri TaxID=316 RepID=UPI0005EB0272|nr:hypothetical protein [Stutzerimonas stutzeri]
MSFDINNEAAEIAERVLVAWGDSRRADTLIDLTDNREHSAAIAPVVERLLSEAAPESVVTVRVDGLRRLVVNKSPA